MKLARAIGLPVVAVGVGLAVLAAGLVALGYDAPAALGALGRGAFGSWYAIGSATLVRSVPLVVIGLGLAIGFRAGAINIGAEGQFAAGAVAATWVGLHVGQWPAPAALSAVAMAGLGAGALWVAVPVLLRIRFGVLEVITTLLLNFVAEAVVSYLVLGPLQEAKGSYPQSDQIAAAARLPVLPGSRLHLGFVVAGALALVFWVVFRRTVWGFRLRAVGQAPRAAAIAGAIRPDRVLAQSLFCSGALAGLAGAFEVSGVTYALYPSLSPGYGFTAIAVALIAGLHPIGVLVAGIGFGALEAGAAGMQREAGVPAVAVSVVQAVIIAIALVSVSRARGGRVEAST
ncbi:MAG: ABC transporter permease [Gemmatimonadales bacterium]